MKNTTKDLSKWVQLLLQVTASMLIKSNIIIIRYGIKWYIHCFLSYASMTTRIFFWFFRTVSSRDEFLFFHIIDQARVDLSETLHGPGRVRSESNGQFCEDTIPPFLCRPSSHTSWGTTSTSGWYYYWKSGWTCLWRGHSIKVGSYDDFFRTLWYYQLYQRVRVAYGGEFHFFC